MHHDFRLIEEAVEPFFSGLKTISLVETACPVVGREDAEFQFRASVQRVVQQRASVALALMRGQYKKAADLIAEQGDKACGRVICVNHPGFREVEKLVTDHGFGLCDQGRAQEGMRDGAWLHARYEEPPVCPTENRV